MTVDLEIWQWLVNQGFAVAVTAFLLVRIEAKLDRIAEKLDNLQS
jgi:hypothetical protein